MKHFEKDESVPDKIYTFSYGFRTFKYSGRALLASAWR